MAGDEQLADGHPADAAFGFEGVEDHFPEELLGAADLYSGEVLGRSSRWRPADAASGFDFDLLAFLRAKGLPQKLFAFGGDLDGGFLVFGTEYQGEGRRAKG